jgi:hypothetical protein
MDYDEDRIYYSYQNLQTDTGRTNDATAEDEDVETDAVNLQAVKRHFREFLREYNITKPCSFQD